MEKLLEVLEKLYADPDAICVVEDGRLYFDTDIQGTLAYEATSLCNEELITDRGQCNINNIGILRRSGYKVFALEKDSFGWLIGGIRKDGSDRILAYG